MQVQNPNVSEHEKVITSLEIDYETQMENYALQKQKEILNPWLEKYQLCYYTANGDCWIEYNEGLTPAWFISKYKERGMWGVWDRLDMDLVPAKIRDLLNTSVYFGHSVLGCYMDKYECRNFDNGRRQQMANNVLESKRN